MYQTYSTKHCSSAHLQRDGEPCVGVAGGVDVTGPDHQMVLVLTLSVQLTRY